MRLLARPLQRPLRNVHRLIARGLGVDGDIELAAKLLQLRDGGGALHVGGDHARLLALLAEVLRELGGVGRLAGALQADEHDDGRRRPGELDLRTLAAILAAEHLHQLVVDDADDLLRGGEAAQHILADGALLHAGDELLDELEVDIGFEQRLAHLAHGVGDVFFGELALAAEPAKDLVEALLQTLEHRRNPFVGGWKAQSVKASGDAVPAYKEYVRRLSEGAPVVYHRA